MKTELYIPNIGNIFVRRSLKAKHISLRVKPDQSVHLVVPKGLSLKDIEPFIRSKEQWISKHQLKFSEVKKENFFEDTHLFHTKRHHVILQRSTVQNFKLAQEHRDFFITIPMDADIISESTQQIFKDIIEQIYRKEAFEILPKRMQQLSETFGFTYARLGIRKAKRRWGSCSSRKTISLNYLMMKLPDHLIDYILLHELTHTIHMNHSSKFWSHLNGVLSGKAKALDRELKQYSPEVL